MPLLHVGGTTRIIPNPCRNPLYQGILEHELEQNNDLPEGGEKKQRQTWQALPQELISYRGGSGTNLLSGRKAFDYRIISSAMVSHSPLQHVLLLGPYCRMILTDETGESWAEAHGGRANSLRKVESSPGPDRSGVSVKAMQNQSMTHAGRASGFLTEIWLQTKPSFAEQSNPLRSKWKCKRISQWTVHRSSISEFA